MSHALEKLVTERFDPSTGQWLRTIALHAEQSGANEEENIIRTAGASFNSRCGRLAHILVVQSGTCDPKLLGALFFVHVLHSHKEVQRVPEFEDALALAKKIVAVLAASPPIDSPLPAMIGALAYSLDSVRHAHMRSDTSPEIFSEAEHVYSKAGIFHEHSAIAKLRSLLLRSLTQQQRLCGQR